MLYLSELPTGMYIEGASLPELVENKQKYEKKLNDSGYSCLCHYFDKLRYGDPERFTTNVFEGDTRKSIYQDRCRDLTMVAQIEKQMDVIRKKEQDAQSFKHKRDAAVFEQSRKDPRNVEARKTAKQLTHLSLPQSSSHSLRLIEDTPTPEPIPSKCSTLAYICLAVAAVAALVAVAAAVVFFFPVLSLSVPLVATVLKVSAGTAVAFGTLGALFKLCC